MCSWHYVVSFFVNEGNRNKVKDYNIVGNKAEKALNAFGAMAAILVCNTSGILPEIQVSENQLFVITIVFSNKLVSYDINIK